MESLESVNDASIEYVDQHSSFAGRIQQPLFSIPSVETLEKENQSVVESN